MIYLAMLLQMSVFGLMAYYMVLISRTLNQYEERFDQITQILNLLNRRHDRLHRTVDAFCNNSLDVRDEVMRQGRILESGLNKLEAQKETDNGNECDTSVDV